MRYLAEYDGRRLLGREVVDDIRSASKVYHCKNTKLREIKR